ncbi:tRNA (adenosine(37)-N6)-threonylcarbamoyltransferase complex dimerization subunit type 1 TsaB [Mycoplasmopsis cynos]|uniref:tRNA (adenosine(37)-N6)-threonylcarbamoyltransferase complex dimerization subunit type 1 TsaB n=1 Tax=Mycoplasmopsis cynos TaxID=171284 RepID=UPI0030CE4DEF
MNIFLDTATTDFVLILFTNEFKVIDYVHYKNYKKKVELIVDEFKYILQKNNINIGDIKAFYTNLGPGFFTGIRSSLIFLRTIALILNQKIYTTNTFEILNFINNDKKDFILDAQGQKYFFLAYNDFDSKDYLKKIKILNQQNLPLSNLNYDDLIKNFSKIKNIFTLESELVNIEPLYIKKPQIGGK